MSKNPTNTRFCLFQRSHQEMAEASDNNHNTDWYRPSLPSQPGTSSVHLPSPGTPSTPRHGYDHRRPLTLSPENNVIDLTQGSQSPPQRVLGPSLHSRYRPALQFPRDIMNRNSEQTPVIDLEAEVNTSAEDLSSDADLQIVGSAVRPHPIEPRYFDSNGFSMFYPPPRPRMGGPARGQSRLSSAASGISRDILSLMGSLPGMLPYEIPAFEYMPPTQPAPRTQRNSYKAPSPALEGLTRCLEDENVPVCPNCNEELGTGSGLKLEIYITRKCGHVSTWISLRRCTDYSVPRVGSNAPQAYCGECAKNRSIAKSKQSGSKMRPFSRCRVPGCNKRVSSPTDMAHLFL